MARGLALGLLVLGIALTHWLRSRRLRTALGIEHLFSTGHAFLLLGALLGLASSNRLVPVVDDVGPIVSLAAGWVGFSTGMRFELRVLRLIPLSSFGQAMAPAVGAALLAGAAGATTLLLGGEDPESSWATALVIGAAAASTGPTLAAALRARRAGHASQVRPVLGMIEFSAGVGDLVVVLLAMVAFSIVRTGPEQVMAPGWLLLAGVGGGGILGVITWLFLGGRAHDNERLLLGLAMLTFTAGFAGWLELSPAAVTAVAAMVLANLPGNRIAQLADVVRRVERPALVILMTVIGFHAAAPVAQDFWLLLASMTLVRLGAKELFGACATRLGPWAPGLRPASAWAHGLLPQGILGLTVTLNFFQVWQDDRARTVLGAVAAASILNELGAPWLLLRLIRGTVGAASRRPGGRPEGP